MLHTSTRKLIDRLSEMTELGKLDWSEGDDGNIAYATEGYSVTLTEAPNEVIITSKDGKELERATAEEIAATETEDGASYTAIVAAMTKEAARVARGTEAAISSLLAGMEDAPAEAAVETEATEPDEPLQEDLGDETAIIATESVETVVEDAPSDEASSDATVEAEPISAQTETPVTEIAEESAESSETTASDEAQDVSTDAVEAEPEPQSETVLDASDEAETSVETVEDDADATEVEAAVTPEADALDDDASEDAPETTLDTPAEAEIEASEASIEAEAASAPEPTVETDASIETEEAADSESEVTEAVARMADEVNGRPDNGLEIAAASAVGAVAAAAGLATADDGDAEEHIAESVTDTPDVAVASSEAEDAAQPPAYVPFGLEASDESEPETAETTIVETAEDTVAATEETPTVDTEARSEPIETPTTFAAAMSDVTEAEPAPDPETETEPAPEPMSAFASAEETETTEQIEEAVVEAAPLLEPVETAEAEAAPEASEPETAPEPEPVFAEAAVTDAPAIDTETSVEMESPEPVLETVAATETPAETTTTESYSLSGIGAGFGLGALSAKTEASGIPGPTSSAPEPTEKVVIDATEDVLPKLEGNLNTALAETASAAVSNAKLETASAGPADEPAEADSDILKPRTRFNPWD